MRYRVCHGLALLALLSACETVPENAKFDLAGHSFEITKKPVAPDPPHAEPR